MESLASFASGDLGWGLMPTWMTVQKMVALQDHNFQCPLHERRSYLDAGSSVHSPLTD